MTVQFLLWWFLWWILWRGQIVALVALAAIFIVALLFPRRIHAFRAPYFAVRVLCRRQIAALAASAALIIHAFLFPRRFLAKNTLLVTRSYWFGIDTGDDTP